MDTDYWYGFVGKTTQWTLSAAGRYISDWKKQNNGTITRNSLVVFVFLRVHSHSYNNNDGGCCLMIM